MSQDQPFTRKSPSWQFGCPHKLYGTQSQGNQGRANSVSQVDTDTHLPALWSCLRRAQKRDNGLCLPFCLGESCPPALTLMSDTSGPPHWCLSSCYPGAGAQREWVWPSLCVGSLKGTAWASSSFFHWLNLCWFLQPEIMWTYLPRTEPWAGGPGVGLGLLAPEISLPYFYPPHEDVGPARSTSLPFLPVWMDVVSLIP